MTKKQIVFAAGGVLAFWIVYWLFFAYCGANIAWPLDSLNWHGGAGDPPGAGVVARFVVAFIGIIGTIIAFCGGAAAAE